MDQFLKNKVALVSGGFAGIGLSISQALAGHGASIAIGARTQRPDIVKQLEDQQTKLFCANLDVRDTLSINQFVGAATSALGPIDILVNAAGISTSQTVNGHSDALWDDVIQTNLSGPFKLTRACLPGMLDRNWGRVINIGSTAARSATADSPAYCASKSGLLGLTRAVALEGAARGVSCVMVSPTWVETQMMQRSMQRRADNNATSVETEFSKLSSQTPQKRLVQPNEISALVAFLCRDEALGITMEDIQVSAGNFW